MKISKYLFLVFLAPLLLTACSTPRHQILGSTYGWDAEKVKVMSDIEINALRVRLVRIANDRCRSGFMEHVELSGPIGPDSSEVVARVLEKITRCNNRSDNNWVVPVVYLNSNGGLLKDGYQLAQTFRRFSVQTVITGQQFCASSCAIAFLGGKYRTMSGDARLAFHSPYWKNGASISCPSREEAKDLSDYYASFLEAKNSQFLFDRTMAFCSQQNGWTINADAAKLFGITTN